jgi:hypothetical protein
MEESKEKENETNWKHESMTGTKFTTLLKQATDEVP